MMLKISLSNAPDFLSGIKQGSLSTGANDFPQGGDSHAADEQLHLAIVETCKAIVSGKVTAMAYVAALLAYARRDPRLAMFAAQLETIAFATAKRIDETLGAGRLVPPVPKPDGRTNKVRAASVDDDPWCFEPPPPPCKI